LTTHPKENTMTALLAPIALEFDAHQALALAEASFSPR
jgi:hypothetical protein